jgi:hypothetical protein
MFEGWVKQSGDELLDIWGFLMETREILDWPCMGGG